MTRFTSSKWAECPKCPAGGAFFYPDDDNGRFFRDATRAAAGLQRAYVLGEPGAVCAECGAELVPPVAAPEQFDNDRNPIYEKLREWGLLGE